MNKIMIGIVALTLLFPVMLCARAEPPTKIIVGCGNFRPMFFEAEGRQPAGHDVDLWRLWSNKTGVAVEFRIMDWAEVIPALLNHEIDVINGATFTPARAEHMLFTEPYLKLISYLFIHNDIVSIGSLAELSGRTIGVLKGSNVEEFLRLNAPDAKIVPFRNYESLVTSAIAGSLDAFISEEPLISYYITLQGGTDDFRRSSAVVLDSSLCMAVRKEEPALLDLINVGFESITAEERAQIDNGWFGLSSRGTSTEHPMYLWLFLLLGMFIAIAAMIALLRAWDKELPDIQSVRKKFMMMWFFYAALLAVPLFVLDILRAIQFGWVPLYTFHLLVVVSVIFVALLNRRIHYHLGMTYVLAMLYLLGLGGMITNGILGTTLLPLMALVVISVILFGMEGGAISILLCLVTIGGVGVAVQLEFITPFNDLNTYSLSFGAWAMVFCLFGFYSIGVGIGIAGVYRHMEDALRARRESESLFRNLVETTSDWIWEANAAGDFVYSSPQVETILGYTPEEVLGKKFYAFMPAEEKKQLANTFSALAREGKTIKAIENANLHKDGRRIVLESSGVPILDKSGRPIGYRGVARDITERKKAEEERERLMFAIEQAAEAVVITDEAANMLYANAAFETITGYHRTEIIGKDMRMMKSDTHDISIYNEIKESVLSGKSWTGRMQNMRRDGTSYMAEVVVSPVRNALGVMINVIVILRDVTNETKLEEQLRQAQKMEAVGQLAGGVAHDFNNLLQAIIGYSDLAIGELRETDPLYSSLDEIMKASQRATTLVRQLLAFSRRQVLEKKDINLNEVVNNLIKMIRRVIGENITLAIHDGGDLGTVHADAGQIEQILMNLCVNARDAMPNGGSITIRTGNKFLDDAFCEANNWHKPGNYACLSVTDTGCGMDEETCAKIYEPFFTTKEVGKGTGLGLATVYGIVKQHDGLIHVFSTPGKGTTFDIYLPIVERSATTAKKQAKGPAPGGTETILVAEDDDIVRRLAQTVLQRSGYKVLAATDGAEALELFNSQKDEISLVVLDVIMPKIGGLAVFERIREANPELCVLFSSGYSIDTVHAGVVFNQRTQMIQKPYHPDDLLRKVRQVLDSKL